MGTADKRSPESQAGSTKRTVNSVCSSAKKRCGQPQAKPITSAPAFCKRFTALKLLILRVASLSASVASAAGSTKSPSSSNTVTEASLARIAALISRAVSQ